MKGLPRHIGHDANDLAKMNDDKISGRCHVCPRPYLFLAIFH
jgi:hypothetical protein